MTESYRSFYEEVGEKYPEEELVYQSLKGRLRRRFVLAWLSSQRGRFLDIGCNRGMYLRSYENGSKFGIDISHAVLRHARKIADLNLAVADAQRLDCIRPGCFDVVLCSEVLEHVASPGRVVEGIRDLLAPGGRVLITAPNYRGTKPEWVETGLLKHFGIRGVNGEQYFHTAFRPEELAAMGTRAGLGVREQGTLEKEIRYMAKFPALVFALFRLMNRLILRSKAWDQFNEHLFNALTSWIFATLHAIRVDRLLNRLVKEGVRSYIILEKPSK